MRHADCGGELRKHRAGVYRCVECGGEVHVGVNPSAHVVDDRAKMTGDAPNGLINSWRSGDFNTPRPRRRQ